MEDSGSVDYRHHNQQSVTDQYPLPRLEEIFTDLQDENCFMSLDLLMR